MQAKNLYTGLLSASLAFGTAGLEWMQHAQPANPSPRPTNPQPRPTNPTPRPTNPQPHPTNPTPRPTNPAPRNPNDPTPSPATPDPNQPTQPRPGVDPGNPVNPGVPANPRQPGSPGGINPNQPGAPGAPGDRANRPGVPFAFLTPQAQALFTRQARQLVQIERRLTQANQESLSRLGEIRQLSGDRQNAAVMDLLQQMLRDQTALQQYLVQSRTLLTGDVDEGDTGENPADTRGDDLVPDSTRRMTSPVPPRTNPR